MFKDDKLIWTWEIFPFLPVVILFILGICVSEYFSFDPKFSLLILFLSLIGYAFFEWKIPYGFNIGRYKFVHLLLISFLIGFSRNEVSEPKWNRNHILSISKNMKGDVLLRGVILSKEQTQKGEKYTVEINEICKESCQSIKTKALVLNYSVSTYDVLDEVQFMGYLMPRRKVNIKAYDHFKHLYNNGIHLTLYVNNAKKTKLLNSQVRKLKYMPVYFREKAIEVYKKYIKDDLVLSLNLAMLLGDRSLLEDDTVKVFSHTGAIHVLAVSGLHVGILIYVLNTIFSFIFGKYTKVYPKTFITISLIICLFYALLVGASPSVLRAVVLFGLLSFVRLDPERGNVYNLLSITAFLMLLFDPRQLFTLSFQFSYIAILSLAMFSNKVLDITMPRNKILKKLWEVIGVSIAVQILLAPLIANSFGFYTTWFFLNGIAAIPLAYIGVWAGILILVLSLLSDTLTLFIVDIYTMFVRLCYQILELITQLPFNLVEGLSLSLLDLVLIYFVIWTCYLYWYSERKSFIMIASYLCFVLFTLNVYAGFNLRNNREVVVYSLSKGYMIDVFEGTSFVSIASGEVSDDSKKFSADGYRRLKASKLLLKLNENEQCTFKQTGTIINNNFIHTNRFRIALNPNADLKLNEYQYIVVGKTVTREFLQSLSTFKGEVILLDEARDWVRDFIINMGGIRIIDLREIGTFRLSDYDSR